MQWLLELPRGASSLMATQHWNPEDSLLFSSTAYADGSRALRIEHSGGRFEAEELWYSRRMRVMFAAFVRIGVGDHEEVRDFELAPGWGQGSADGESWPQSVDKAAIVLCR